MPLHLRDVPELPEPHSKEFARAVLAPARSGLLFTRHDLTSTATATGLAARVGGRVFALRALLEQDRAATFGWLAQHAARWARVHRDSVPALGRIAEHWLGRAHATQRVLEQISQHT